jgi:hypothetical protein
MNRGGLGARALNLALQQALNSPGDNRVERFGWTFCPGDKGDVGDSTTTIATCSMAISA